LVHHLLVPQEQAWCKHTTTPGFVGIHTATNANFWPYPLPTRW
jgi:hypothetical protein